jgi:exopolyphosphatase / guanosine-5'-triphosphate,3'-diphosphate pyrophosphatase
VRIAVVDIGTNTTRLLVADVTAVRESRPPARTPGALTELDRRSTVTRLGEGVDRSGRLSDEAQRRVLDVLDEYAEAIALHGAERSVAVLTSAVRDADNGADFTERVRRDYGLDARTLTGGEEARLTFLGATAQRSGGEALLVADIGGGSTELVVGAHGAVHDHVSTQNGVVRHTERHLHHDPPTGEELDALARDVRESLRAVPFNRADAAVAVAGTPTQCAAIDLELDPYDPVRVEGHVLTAERLAAILDRVASVPLGERRRIRGLDPARAPVIVAGVLILQAVLAHFGLDRVAVSEHDILWGVALDCRPGG